MLKPELMNCFPSSFLYVLLIVQMGLALCYRSVIVLLEGCRVRGIVRGILINQQNLMYDDFGRAF